MARALLLNDVRTAIASFASTSYFKNARVCITPGGVPYVKVVHNGHVVEKLHIEVLDKDNTYSALCALSEKCLK
tara:strand:+ start:524 stop:745 length:222 start_codon:yes stop_codon:yes gene_type:complete